MQSAATCILIAFAIVIGATTSEAETSFTEDTPISPVRDTKVHTVPSHAAKVKELDAEVAMLNKRRSPSWHPPTSRHSNKLALLGTKKETKKRKARAKGIVKALEGKGAASGKNSIGADINTGGRHYKAKTVTRDYGGGPKKKVIPPGYDTSDTWKDPWGHYYLGPSRRRIGAGFGRRRRTVHYKRKVSRKKSRRILRKIMSFKKGKSVVHKRAHPKYVYRSYKLPRYNWSVNWHHRRIGFRKKHIKHMWDTSKKKKKKKRASPSQARRVSKSKGKKTVKAVIDDNFWMQLTQQLEKMPPNLMDETPKKP